MAMSTLAAVSPIERNALQVDAFAELEPISRIGGQGRVYRPALAPSELGPEPIVVKLYRRAPSMAAARVLGEMVAWSGSLEVQQRARLRRVAAWPLAVVYSGSMPVGIALEDVSGRFAAPFVMPSGRRERVLMALEHLLGDDSYLELRGLGVRLDADMRARVGERICEALGCLHRQGIVASDIAPSNLLVSVAAGGPSVCFIDCDSMVFRGRQALAPVETGDWNVPFDEPLGTRAADAYKLGLIVLRLFARSHDARTAEPHLRHVPSELRGLLVRALGADAVNRPPTGEWQLALRQALARGYLGERYPGPAPRVRAVAPASVGVRARAPVGVGAVAPVVAAAPPAKRRTGPMWLQPAVVALWLLAGTAVLALILSRLFAAAVPRWESGPAPQAPAVYQIYPGGGQVPGQFQGQGGQVPGQGGQVPGQAGQFQGQGGASP
jgi:hypothetical protein